jgi:hypothetical protein
VRRHFDVDLGRCDLDELLPSPVRQRRPDLVDEQGTRGRIPRQVGYGLVDHDLTDRDSAPRARRRQAARLQGCD